MDLISSLTGKGNARGITLNSQNIDLFNIIEQTLNREEAVQKVYDYLDEILQASKFSQKINSQGLNTEQKIKKIVDEISTLSGNSEFLNFLLQYSTQIRANWDTKETLEKLFEGEEIDNSYIDEILNIKKYFAHQTHGILSFLVDKDGQTINPDNKLNEVDKEKTFQKILALYNYVTGHLENGENRFTRLTLDGQGKFGTVAGVMSTDKEAQASPKDYNLGPLRQGYEFAKRHGMNEVYINALVFFKDFPDRLVGGTPEQYQTALTNYGKAIASVAKEYENQGIHTSIDMFNEFVDYYAPFSERTNNWMSKLNVKDLCQIALTLKQEMPAVSFGYNDWNFENPEKRKTIFEVIRKIQEFEGQNNCKILDHIGTQCHTSINKDDIEGLRKSIEELQQFELPIYITELDISKGLDGVDYENATPEEMKAIRKKEQKLQNDVMKMLSEFVKVGKVRGITSWSITDELCCDFCDGKEASVTGMSYDCKNGFSFSGKDMDTEIKITSEDENLISDHIGVRIDI